MPTRTNQSVIGYVGAAFLTIIVLGGLAKMGQPGTSNAGAPPTSQVDVPPERTPAPKSPFVLVADERAAAPAPAVVPRIVSPPKKGILKEAAKFVPKTVKLTEPMSVTLFEKGQPVGLRPLPAGTILRVKGIKGDKVTVEYGSGSEEIPATATDLVEQMVDALERSLTGS